MMSVGFGLVAVSALLGLSIFTPANPQRMSLAGVGFMTLGAMVAGFAAAPAHGAVLTLLVMAAASSAVAGLLIDVVLKKLDAKTFAIATFAFSLAMTLYATTDRFVSAAYMETALPRYPSQWGAVLALAFCVAVCKVATGNRFEFAAGAMAAGVAGTFLVGWVPATFDTTTLFELLCLAISAAVLGGRRSAFGPVLGAIGVILALSVMELASSWAPYLAGPLIIASLIWLPDGLLGIANRVYGSFKQRRANGAA